MSMSAPTMQVETAICNQVIKPPVTGWAARWVWPLPPAGPLEFICQWPVYGIGETRIGIDGQLILDAARRSVQLWPEDDPDAAA